MGMKIWWQHIFPTQDQMEREVGFTPSVPLKDVEVHFQKHLQTVARPGTEINAFYLKHSAYMVQSYYLEMLNTLWVIDGVIEAEKQGYDAAIIGCAMDPGLLEARQAVDIPVIGPMEAAMFLACSLGSRVGVITVMDELVPMCERAIRHSGLEARVAGRVRVHDMGEDWINMLFEMILKPEVIQPQFDMLCKASVKDGAEVIIPACCALSPAASLLGYREVPGTGVPIVDVTLAAVKLAETLVDLKRSVGLGKSRKWSYKSQPAQVRDLMRSLVYMARA